MQNDIEQGLMDPDAALYSINPSLRLRGRGDSEESLRLSGSICQEDTQERGK